MEDKIYNLVFFDNKTHTMLTEIVTANDMEECFAYGLSKEPLILINITKINDKMFNLMSKSVSVIDNKLVFKDIK